jgi:hypothetical protein
MALNFTGESLSPKRGGNGLARKLEGVRVAKLKKGQNQITLGDDVMTALGLTADQIDGKLKAAVTKGTDKFAGKVLIKFGEGDFLVRWTSPKRKTSIALMSSALPVDANGKADYKVFADEKAIVIQMPTAPAAGGGDLSV